jgi:hypothetical protein
MACRGLPAATGPGAWGKPAGQRLLSLLAARHQRYRLMMTGTTRDY